MSLFRDYMVAFKDIGILVLKFCITGCIVAAPFYFTIPFLALPFFAVGAYGYILYEVLT